MSKYESKILTTKYLKPDAYGSLSMPVYYTAAYEFPSAKACSDAFAGRSMDFAYSRISNPTVQYFEKRVQAVTGAASVTALNMGMTAITYALTALAAAGKNIVISPHLFGNTVSFIRDTLGEFGVETRYADLLDKKDVESKLDENTVAIFFEVITNPQLSVANIQDIADLAHAHHVPIIVDSTVIPFSRFHAKDFGADIEVISSTKYISNGGTGLGGILLDYGRFDWKNGHTPALQRRARRVGKMAFTARIKTELITNLGGLMTPQVAYMESLGLETLDIRFERQASSTLWLAQQLQKVPEIKKVSYTGLKDSPFYEISKKQFGPLPGAMFTIDLESKEACFNFIDRLKIIRKATNLFDHRSLAIHPASTIFVHFNAEERAAMDVYDTTIRLSIGLEDREDLLEDIRQALVK